MADFTAEELEAEAATTEAPIQDNGQPRDEAGRFAPVEPTEEAPEGVEQQQRTTRVPHQALHAEREAHKGTKAELAAAREQLTQIAQLRERLAQSQRPPEPVQQPEGEQGSTDYLARRLETLEQANRARDMRDTETGIANHETQVLTNALVASEAQFKQATPDYEQAINHLASARIRQLQMVGLQPHEIQAALQTEVAELTRAAIAQNRDPAEFAYGYAQSYGYQPQQQAQGQQPNANAMLEAIARGQKQGRSLANARGGVSTGDVNANALANMSEEEFIQLAGTPEGAKLIAAIG